MIKIPAKAVYIDPEIHDLPNCKRRLDRALPRVNCKDVRVLGPGDLQEVFAIGKRRHGKDDFGDDAILVFSTFDETRRSWFYHWREEAGRHGGQCQPALELNIVDGCVFRCAYCGFGRYVVFYLDVERLIDGLDGVFREYPQQRLYKYSNKPLDSYAGKARHFAKVFVHAGDTNWLKKYRMTLNDAHQHAPCRTRTYERAAPRNGLSHFGASSPV